MAMSGHTSKSNFKAEENPKDRGALADRVVKLENNEANLSRKIAAFKSLMEEQKEELKRGMSKIPDQELKFDASELEEKIQGVRNLLDSKVSQDQVSSLKFEMQKYTDRGDNDIKKYYDKNIEEIRHTLEMTRAELEQHIQ